MAMHTDTETPTRVWTLEELHSLPDDGNKYELIHGVLYMTPAPRPRHELVAARLTRILDPYVEAQGLGFVFHPRAVFRIGRVVEVEPDLFVAQPHPELDSSAWERAPLPILMIEILSRSTRRRDFGVKRALYVDEARIPEYWVVNGETRTITVYRPGHDPVTVDDRWTWAPAGAREPLVVELARVFG